MSADPRPVCEGFCWIGQSFRSCDRCGNPYWEHTHDERPDRSGGPFSGRRHDGNPQEVMCDHGNGVCIYDLAPLPSVPTVELLTRAADAAGRAADWLDLAEVSEGMPLTEVLAGDAYVAEVCQVVAASGPNHWRAVEGAFRNTGVLLDAFRAVGKANQGAANVAECLRPLAEQVLRDLGDSDVS